MKLLTIVLVFLSGCSTLGDKMNLENRVVCTVNGEKAYVVSEYGPVGISSVISPKDTPAICRP